MAKFPAMPLWTDALLGDTTHLTATEFGAYMRLLISMWRNGAWLLNDERLMAKYATLTSGQWKRSRGVLMPFFTPDGDRITQRKLMKTWVAVEQKSKSAKNSANARWLKEKKTGDANASNPQCERNDNQNQRREERATDVAPKKTPASVLSPLLGSELAAGVVEHRQRLRKPMTVKAAELMLREFEKCTEPIAGAEMMISRGWQGFRADWFKNDTIRQRTNGDDRTTGLLAMADGLDRRAAPDSEVDHGAGAGDAEPLLPARVIGRD